MIPDSSEETESNEQGLIPLRGLLMGGWSTAVSAFQVSGSLYTF